jgi:hypothetical protein
MNDAPGISYPNSSALMEDYRFGTEITDATSISQLINPRGESEIFYADSAGDTIYNVYPDSGSDTGWSVTPITCPFQAGALTGGSAGGTFTLFSIGPDQSNPAIFYTQRDTSGTWGSWNFVDASSVTDQFNSAKVDSIAAEAVNGSLELVAVLSEGDSAQGMWRVGWTGNSGWQRLGDVGSSFLDVCTTAPWGAGVLGSCVNADNVTTFDLLFFSFDGTITRTLASQLSAPRIDAALLKSGPGSSSGIFIYQYDPNTNTGSVSFIDCSVPSPASTQIDTTLLCSAMVAVNAGANPIFLSTLDSSSQLHILVQMGGGWNTIELGAPLSSISAGLAADGAPLIFGVPRGGNGLHSMLQQPESAGGEWTTQEIAAQTSTIEKIAAYGTTFTLVDANQNFLSNTTVSVTSGENVTFSTGQQTFDVGPGAPPAVLTTTGNGQVTLYAPTGTINGAKLLFSSEGITPAGQHVAVDVDDGVRQKLQGIRTEQITQWTGNADDALHVQKAVKQALDYTTSGVNGLPKKTRYVAAGSLAGYERPLDLGAGELVPWSFTVRNGRATFSELTPAGAAALRASLSGDALVAADLGGFFDWLGDIAEAFVNAVASAITYVVEPIANAIRATINCVIDGVTYVFEGVIATIERAFQVAESIFTAVGVFFEKLFSFAAWLLSDAIGDIWNTKRQFETLINQSFGSLTTIAQNGENASADFFTKLKTTVAAQFDLAISSVGSDTFDVDSLGLTRASPAGVTSTPSSVLDFLSESAVTINWLFDKVTSLGMSSFAPSLSTSLSQTFLDQVVTNVENAAAAVQGDIAAVQGHFASIAGDPASLMAATLQTVLEAAKAVVLAVIDIMDAVVKSLFDFAMQFLAFAKTNLFDVKIGGFLLGPLYDLFQPIPDAEHPYEELTLTRFVALVAAFPATVLYRLIEGTAPFASGAAGELAANGPNIWKQLAGLITCSVWAIVDVMLDAGVPSQMLTVLSVALPFLLIILTPPGSVPFTFLPGHTLAESRANAFWVMKWVPVAWTAVCCLKSEFTSGPRANKGLCGILGVCGAAVLTAGVMKGTADSDEGTATAGSWFLDIAGPLVTLAKPLSGWKPYGTVALFVVDTIGNLGTGGVTYVTNS